jgi:hypothetical protein
MASLLAARQTITKLISRPTNVNYFSSATTTTTMSTTFEKKILKGGSGAPPAVGANVTVEANLYLAQADKTRGTAIWSTHQPSGFLFPSASPSPFSYSSGTGGVITGWDDGVGTMTKGERAELYIPWEHAYGAQGHPGFKIPPKAPLIFEIEVLKIE